MSKPDEDRWPNLKRDWEAYGHAVKWRDLIDMKVAMTHGYVVLAWMEGDMVNYADLASPDGSKTWEMQNDGHEPITPRQWRTAKIKPMCDELVLKEDEDADD